MLKRFMNDVVIKVEGLTKIFPPSYYALKEVSFTVKRGEIFGVVGLSGAGKSTLMRHLLCLDSPTKGKIWIENEEVTSLDKHALLRHRKKMGVIFQHFNLLNSRSAWENVAFPLELEGMSSRWRKQKCEELLAIVGLEGKQEYYPSQLSGGEKQRVAIARALAGEPSVLFSDEATSALDPKTTKTILDLLVKLNQSLHLTIVLITHQMEVIKHVCTKVAVLDQGQIVELSDVVDLFTKPKHATTQHMLQTLLHEIPPRYFKEGSRLLRLAFKGESAAEPLISRMIKKFDVEVNILLGGIDYLQSTTIGNLVIQMSGAPREILQAREYLERNGVVVKEEVKS